MIAAKIGSVACRLTGRAVFRKQLLSQEGILVSIPEVDVIDSNATRLAEYLKPRLQAAAGESLKAYCASSVSDVSIAKQQEYYNL